MGDEAEVAPLGGEIDRALPQYVGLLSALRGECDRLQAHLAAAVEENARLRSPTSAATLGAASPASRGYVHGPVPLVVQQASPQEAPSSGDVCTDRFVVREAFQGDLVQPTPQQLQSLEKAGITWCGTESDDEAFGSVQETMGPRVDTLVLNERPSKTKWGESELHAADFTNPLVQRIFKLHMWFKRIDQRGSGVLSQSHLQKIYRRVNGAASSIPSGMLDRILTVLADLEVQQSIFDEEVFEAIAALQDIAHPGRLCGLPGTCTFTHSADDLDVSLQQGMDFTTFAMLIVWDGLNRKLPYDLHCTATRIRDALIKHSADVLVAHHAHLKIPDPEDVKEPPIALVILDSISGFMIAMNGLTIGLSSDFDDWGGFEYFEAFFAIYFLFEMLFKLYYTGCKHHFLGPDMRWNWFDAAVVSVSMLDFVLYVYQQSLNAKGSDDALGHISMIRVARLARLTRLIRLLRVLRLRMFKELILMVKGVVAGMRTLVWAIVMLLFIAYTGAVVMRQMVGPDKVSINDAYGTILFSDLLWSMFMLFRILMQDGVLPDGTPIAGRMYELYGVRFMVPYMLSLLFAVFGVFNLMTALFVENVLEAAKQKKQLSLVHERVRVAQKLRELVLKFTGQTVIDEPASVRIRFMVWWRSTLSVDDSMSSSADHFFDKFKPTHNEFEMEGNITRHMFQEAINDPKVDQLLNDLEVQMSDRTELFDVLDADGSGAIDISELISGLMKLRSGGADKSDAVATVLGIRAIQGQMRALELAMTSRIRHSIDLAEEGVEKRWRTSRISDMSRR